MCSTAVHRDLTLPFLLATRGAKSPQIHAWSILDNTMAAQRKSKQLWIGLVEVRPLNSHSEILGDTKGAFVTIVTWASDAEEYRRNAELVIGHLGLFVAEVITPEPVELRRARTIEQFEEEIEDIISRAQANPNAIIYGTFHTFERDDV